jgi:hypothetical protein
MTARVSHEESMEQVETYSWSGTQVNEHLALLQKVVLLIQLDQLEGSSGSIALLLGQTIVLIETAFAMLLVVSALFVLVSQYCSVSYLLLDSHGGLPLFATGEWKQRRRRMDINGA